jgi:hypothetical protein
VTSMWKKINAQGVWWQHLNDRDNLQDLGLDWKVLSKRTSQKQDGSELNLCGEGEGQMTGTVNTVTKFRVPNREGNLFTGLRAIYCSRRTPSV